MQNEEVRELNCYLSDDSAWYSTSPFSNGVVNDFADQRANRHPSSGSAGGGFGGENANHGSASDADSSPHYSSPRSNDRTPPPALSSPAFRPPGLGATNASSRPEAFKNKNNNKIIIIIIVIINHLRILQKIRRITMW